MGVASRGLISQGFKNGCLAEWPADCGMAIGTRTRRCTRWRRVVSRSQTFYIRGDRCQRFQSIRSLHLALSRARDNRSRILWPSAHSQLLDSCLCFLVLLRMPDALCSQSILQRISELRLTKYQSRTCWPTSERANPKYLPAGTDAFAEAGPFHRSCRRVSGEAAANLKGQPPSEQGKAFGQLPGDEHSRILRACVRAVPGKRITSRRSAAAILLRPRRFVRAVKYSLWLAATPITLPWLAVVINRFYG
jgi:hypothetical protein